jgi:hypothetical protein
VDLGNRLRRWPPALFTLGDQDEVTISAEEQLRSATVTAVTCAGCLVAGLVLRARTLTTAAWLLPARSDRREEF